MTEKHRHKAVIEKSAARPLSIFLKLDASGKSPAYVHRRRKPARSPKGCGFFHLAVLIGDGFQPPPPSDF
jgi:hypothetical protein